MLAVDAHPGADLAHDAALVGVVCPSRLTGTLSSRLPFLLTMSISVWMTVLAGLYLCSRSSLSAVVVPVTEAGVGLPGRGLDGIALAALDVPDHAAALLLIEDLAEQHGLRGALARGVQV